MRVRIVGRRVSRRALGLTAGAGGIRAAGAAGRGAPAFGAGPAGPAPQATAQATAQAPQPTPGPPPPAPTPRPVRFFPVAPPFQAYYALVNGPQTMGSAISPLTTSGGL